MNRLTIKAWEWFADRIISRARRTPWVHISDAPYTHKEETPTDYMRRYWLFNAYDDETNKKPISFLPSVRVHNIRRSDDDRAFHDHPWWFVTIILKGGYYELTPHVAGTNEAVVDGSIRREYVVTGHRATWYGPGSILFRRAGDWHRLVVPNGEEAWTLFFTGKKVQEWGFLLNDFIKMPYRMYINLFGGRS